MDAESRFMADAENSYLANDFAILVHADVVATFFSFYSNMTPKCLCLNNKESWNAKNILALKPWKMSRII